MYAKYAEIFGAVIFSKHQWTGASESSNSFFLEHQWMPLDGCKGNCREISIYSNADSNGDADTERPMPRLPNGLSKTAFGGCFLIIKMNENVFM